MNTKKTTFFLTFDCLQTCFSNYRFTFWINSFSLLLCLCVVTAWYKSKLKLTIYLYWYNRQPLKMMHWLMCELFTWKIYRSDRLDFIDTQIFGNIFLNLCNTFKPNYILNLKVFRKFHVQIFLHHTMSPVFIHPKQKKRIKNKCLFLCMF